ncbi:DUF4303 domain-containing protein [Microbacterium testaceum]|uniref:DUF4303 domain-containing protein n=1 Tax=Microbacterium testaceum TaxID=2033 RepID=UPI0034125509
MAVDRRAVEEAAVAQLVAAVRTVRDEHPEEHIYGAMFHEFYGDGSVIYWPMVTVGTEESLAEAIEGYSADERDELSTSLRWSGSDLAHSFDPTDHEQALADAVQAHASTRGDFAGWEREWDRFVRCFPRAAKAARRILIADGTVGKDFLAIAADESGDLIPRSLTRAQLLAHFPEYEEAARERVRLASLPLEQRVAELVPEAVTPRYEGPLIGEHEALLVACGEAAVPALVRVVRREQLPDGDVVAARLLAEINIDTPEVIDALVELMCREDADVHARAWAACALARLGRSDLILARAPDLPNDIVVSGISDPFRSFRDHGAHRTLDYDPLERALDDHPELEPAFREQLRPGTGFCVLTPDDIPIARAALSSRWELIRTHARITLEDAGTRL